MDNCWNMDRKWMHTGWNMGGKRMENGWNTDGKLMEHEWKRAGQTLKILNSPQVFKVVKPWNLAALKS